MKLCKKGLPIQIYTYYGFSEITLKCSKSMFVKLISITRMEDLVSDSSLSIKLLQLKMIIILPIQEFSKEM